MNNDFDKQLSSYMKNKTDEVTQLKETIWSNIEKETVMKRTRAKKRKRWIFVVAAAIMFTFVGMGLGTSTGQALIKNFKEMFVPEQKIDIHIEGDKEETDMGLETNESLDYIIYVDHSRYKVIEGTYGDKIIPVEEFEDQYPEVSMEIWRVRSIVEDTIADIKADMDKQAMTVGTTEDVTSPLVATKISFYGESDEANYDWDTPIYTYYVTEATNGQLFVIKQMYFLEASEGHAVRFDAMLEQFEIVEVE